MSNPRKRKAARTKREPVFQLNLRLDKATKKQLDDLQVRTRAPSLTQVIRNALTLFERYADAKDAGGALLIDDGNGKPQRVEFL